jgi:hypothetical protein
LKRSGFAVIPRAQAGFARRQAAVSSIKCHRAIANFEIAELF